MKRNRRTFLAGAAAAGATGLSGCLDMLFRSGDESDDEDDESDVVEEDPRVDPPIHEIRPAERDIGVDDGGTDWNEMYLAAGLPEEPSLYFDAFDDVPLQDPALSPGEASREYHVAFALDEDELHDLVDVPAARHSVRNVLENVRFDQQFVVAVESGYGSSSIHHHWARVEDGDDGPHLHGAYRVPETQTTDEASRTSVLVVERPSDMSFDLARVSLTVAEDARVHFNSTEGVVEADV